MGVAPERCISSRKTSELAGWISKIKLKKNNSKIQRRRNLFVEAVLSNALARAQAELRQKQHERRLRWHKLMSSCGVDAANSTTLPQNWDMKIYEEINADLDNFMNQLKSTTSMQSWPIFVLLMFCHREKKAV